MVRYLPSNWICRPSGSFRCRTFTSVWFTSTEAPRSAGPSWKWRPWISRTPIVFRYASPPTWAAWALSSCASPLRVAGYDDSPMCWAAVGEARQAAGGKREVEEVEEGLVGVVDCFAENVFPPPDGCPGAVQPGKAGHPGVVAGYVAGQGQGRNCPGLRAAVNLPDAVEPVDGPGEFRRSCCGSRS